MRLRRRATGWPGVGTLASAGAEQGYLPAHVGLGFMYEAGRGMPPDNAEARRLSANSAESSVSADPLGCQRYRAMNGCRIRGRQPRLGDRNRSAAAGRGSSPASDERNPFERTTRVPMPWCIASRTRLPRLTFSMRV